MRNIVLMCTMFISNCFIVNLFGYTWFRNETGENLTLGILYKPTTPGCNTKKLFDLSSKLHDEIDIELSVGISRCMWQDAYVWNRTSKDMGIDKSKLNDQKYWSDLIQKAIAHKNNDIVGHTRAIISKEGNKYKIEVT